MYRNKQSNETKKLRRPTSLHLLLPLDRQVNYFFLRLAQLTLSQTWVSLQFV